jgi:hypothetical protein
MESESRVTVSRSSPEDAQQRQVIVKLDGEWIADLVHGRKISKVVTPGRHRLQVDNTWQKKKVEFDVAPGEEVKFQTINRNGKLTWFLVSTLGVGPMYISLEREA